MLREGNKCNFWNQITIISTYVLIYIYIYIWAAPCLHVINVTVLWSFFDLSMTATRLRDSRKSHGLIISVLCFGLGRQCRTHMIRSSMLAVHNKGQKVIFLISTNLFNVRVCDEPIIQMGVVGGNKLSQSD